MKFRERKRKHDDAHIPMGGRGKRGTMPKKKRDDKPSREFIEKWYIDPLKSELLNRHYPVKKYNLGNTKRWANPRIKKTDFSKPVCEKCFANVNPETAIKVTLDEDIFELWEDSNGKMYIGPDCWKRILRENK